MHLIKFVGRDRHDISIEDTRQLQGPVMVFLGGLLHIQDIDTGGGFATYLNKLCGDSPAHVLMPLDENCNDTAALDDYMVAYGHGHARPSAFAEEIHQAIFAPMVAACDVSDECSIECLKADMSRISLIGYSYGTSLVQQLSECVAMDLLNRFQDDPHRGLKVFDICRSVKGLNIGPVMRYNAISPDGAIYNLEHTDPCFSSANTLFSQMSFLMQHDKIAQKSFGRELLGGLRNSDTGIEARNTTSSSLLIDFVAEPIHKAIGYMKIPSGIEFPKIITSYDFILHDMRSYVNVRERQGNLIVFPTLAIAPVLRRASEMMFFPEMDGRDWLSAVRHLFDAPEKRASLVNSFNQHSADFRAAIKTFEEKEYDDAVNFLKAFVESGGDSPARPERSAPLVPGLNL